MDILNQFGISPILLTAQVVNFLILLFILKKFLYKPILKVLKERKARIEASLKNAEEIEKKLADTEIQAEKMLAKVIAEGQKIIDQTNESAAQILKDANKASEEILLKASDDGRKIIELQKEMLMKEVKENATDLVLAVFRKVTGKVISKDEQKKLIEKEVKNLS